MLNILILFTFLSIVGAVFTTVWLVEPSYWQLDWTKTKDSPHRCLLYDKPLANMIQFENIRWSKWVAKPMMMLLIVTMPLGSSLTAESVTESADHFENVFVQRLQRKKLHFFPKDYKSPSFQHRKARGITCQVADQSQQNPANPKLYLLYQSLKVFD